MKVWSRAGSKNPTTNSQRAKGRGERQKKRKCQRGDPGLHISPSSLTRAASAAGEESAVL